MIQLAIDGQIAYVAAQAAYADLITAEDARGAADTTLFEALVNGEPATSPAEHYGELVQEAINARNAHEEAQAAYTSAVENLTMATTAYEAILPADPVPGLMASIATLEEEIALAGELFRQGNERLLALEATDAAVTTWCGANAHTTLCEAREAQARINREIDALRILLD
jgi:hypothetical protein